MQKCGSVWYVLREFIANDVTTKQMCSQIIHAIDEYGTKKLILMGDAHGKDKKTNGADYSIMLAFFTEHGYDMTLRVQRANPLIVERLAVLRRKICNGKMERFFYVDSSCNRLLYNMDACRNNLATGGLKIPTANEIEKDDDLRYLIHPIDAISYPLYFEQKYTEMTGENFNG